MALDASPTTQNRFNIRPAIHILAWRQVGAGRSQAQSAIFAWRASHIFKPPAQNKNG
jgi:hypothetical protein